MLAPVNMNTPFTRKIVEPTRICIDQGVGLETCLPQNAMSLSFWAQACATTVGRPLQVLLDTAYACCGVTVSVLAGLYMWLW